MDSVIRRPSPGSLAALVVVVAAVLAHASRRPREPSPGTAPDSVFSGERAMRHVRAIGERPHPAGSADHARVRRYVETELAGLGLLPEVQEVTAVSTRFREVGRVQNVMARRAGKGPGTGAVLLAAHYDGVGAAPAAGDDGSGTAVLLETLRALRAGPPLEHDVIALFTDGEEAGLLGAAAFVREHPWAKDVRMILNFEARGTGGQAVMFQTGPGNWDQIRELRRLPNLSASSLAVTVYQFLPNDTDLSEFFALQQPALNFAFADGVERYHTSEDDPAHLEAGSVQQEGDHALALTKAFANGPFPRARTGNAIFFDLPILGLVAYPESWAWPLAILAAVLAVIAATRIHRAQRHWIRHLVLGGVGLIVSIPLAGGLAYLAVFRGPASAASPGWRAVYGTGIALLAVVSVLLPWALLRRWASAAGLHLAALLGWIALTLLATWKAPGASFIFTWPVIAASVAAIAAAGPASAASERATRWAAIVVGALLVLPMVDGMGITALGVVGLGGVAIGLLVALLAWLLLPELELVAGSRRWSVSLAALGAGILLIGVAVTGGRRATDYPTRSALAYAQDADASDAWLATAAFFAVPGSWESGVLGPAAIRISPRDTMPRRGPEWLSRAFGPEFAIVAAPVARVAIPGPTVTTALDSVTAQGRRVVLQVRPTPGTLVIGIRAVGTRVLSATVDGRPIDPSRYRQQSPVWFINYSAPSDSGFKLGLVVPAGSAPVFELVSQVPGLPAIPGVTIPSRPAHVVPSQMGDVSVVYRKISLASR